jgi:methanesulfonate monooxygenase small subunit
MTYIRPEILQPIQQLVYRSCLFMNDESWKDYLALCDPQSFRYRITNYSPEIRKEQVWADRDFKAMKASFDLLPRHNSDRSKLTRQVSIYTVDYDERAREANVVSALTVYRTQLDGLNSYIDSGQTHLYAVGLYKDRIKVSEEAAKLVERVVRLDTRQLDVGSHKPF